MAASGKTLRFKTRVDRFAADGGFHYLPIPKKVFDAFGGKYNTRVVCAVDGGPAFSCALISDGSKRGRAAVFFSKARMKAASARQGKQVTVELKPDTSRYGMPVPAELKECLKQDREAKRRFDALSAGKQRNIIYFVSQLKNADRRTDRAFRLLERLKRIPEGAKGREFSAIFKPGEPPPPPQARADEEFLKKILPITALGTKTGKRS